MLNETSRLELIAAGIMRMKASLLSWYHRNNTDNKITQLQDLTHAMLGEANARCLKTKAAETKGFMMFLIELASSHNGRCLDRQDVWVACGTALSDLLQIFSSPSLRISVEIYQDFDRLDSVLVEERVDVWAPSDHFGMGSYRDHFGTPCDHYWVDFWTPSDHFGRLQIQF